MIFRKVHSVLLTLHTITYIYISRLPVDLYQTAKVSKMLLMIENGVPVEHKGKNLSEIEIDVEFAEENNDGNYICQIRYYLLETNIIELMLILHNDKIYWTSSSSKL